MYMNMNCYVAEETRQAEDLRQADAYRLTRQAEKTRTAGRKIICALLIGLGERLLALGCRMQEQMDNSLSQVLGQAK
jgi:hypothetical protein